MSIFDRAVAAACLGAAMIATAAAADRSAVVMPEPGKPFFFQLAPIFVPVIVKDRVTRQVSIAVAVEIADGKNVPAVEKKRPALSDAFLRDIYVFVQQREGIGSPAAELALKSRLRQTALRVLKPVPVKSVQIEEFFERRE